MTDASRAEGRQPIDAQMWMRAAGAGDAARVESLLAAGADVNAALDGGETALIRATSKGHLSVVRLLIDAGADVNAEREDGFTALGLAVFFGYADIVRALLAGGADPSAKGRLGTTAEKWARFSGFSEIVDLLRNADTIRVQDDGAERATPRRRKTDAALLFPTEGPFSAVVPLSDIADIDDVSSTSGDAPRAKAAAQVGARGIVRGASAKHDAREHEEVTVVPARAGAALSGRQRVGARLGRALQSWPVTVVSLAVILIVGVMADAHWKRSNLSANTRQPAPSANDDSSTTAAGNVVGNVDGDGVAGPQPATASAGAQPLQPASEVTEPGPTNEPEREAVSSAPVVASREANLKAATTGKKESDSRSKSSTASSEGGRASKAEAEATRREIVAAEARARRTAVTPIGKKAVDAPREVRASRVARRAEGRVVTSSSRENSLPVFSPAPSAGSGKKKVIQWP